MSRFKSYKTHELSLDDALFIDAYNKKDSSIERIVDGIEVEFEEVETIYFTTNIDLSEFNF